MDNRKILKGKNATYKGRKIVNINKKKWQIEKKEDRTNNKIKNQPDSNICI